MRTLNKLTIKGFKSIRDQTLELGKLNVFIGGNGVGKSNLIGSFRFLHEVVNQRLARYVSKRGDVDSILHFGRKTTPQLSFDLEFGEGNSSNAYSLVLEGTDDGGLTIASETSFYHDKQKYRDPYRNPIGSYINESKLRDDSQISANQVTRDLDSYQVYHFHDTSEAAPMKGVCDIEDNVFLRPQADNLAAFLYLLQERHPDHFSLIEDTVKQIAPFFGGFKLQPSRLNPSKIRLEWQEVGHDNYFNATSLSDGTIRFICLATLLLQPDYPSLILLDEPELGLHPAAVTLLADLLSSASERTQVMVATQSVTLINQLSPEDIWTVNREGDQSVFQKLTETDQSAWLDNYALGELWEKNLITARP
jgi:predicted ATPase